MFGFGCETGSARNGRSRSVLSPGAIISLAASLEFVARSSPAQASVLGSGHSGGRDYPLEVSSLLVLNYTFEGNPFLRAPSR